MRQLPKPGEIYKHFKGNCYRIITVAAHADTGEKLVIYQALYGDYEIYARELSVFAGPVDKQKYPYVMQKKRFELLESGAAELVGQETDVEQISGSKSGRDGRQTAKQSGEDSPERSPEISVSSVTNKNTGSKNTDGFDAMQSPEKETESGIDPVVLAYLDADTCKEKLQILTEAKDRLTDDMINTMAIAIDVEVKPGDITERYEELKYCLATKDRFECRRLR